MNTTTETKTMTEAAQAAKLVRLALKKAFPGTTFRVRSDNFSGGDAVRIRWTDGPSYEAVDAIVQGYSSGTFDGMTDSFEYDRDRKGPTAMFVTCTRDISDELHGKLVATLRETFVTGASVDFETLAYRILRKSDLRGGFGGIRSTDGFPGFEIVPVAA